MTALEVKKKLQGHYYFNGFNMSCTEFGVYGGWADVFIAQKNRYTHEFEVKVSEADLMSEIKCIDHIFNGDRESINYLKLSATKYDKHRAYTGGEDWLKHMMTKPANWIFPNKFSFVAPSDLLVKIQSKKPQTYFDILNLCDLTGYGLYAIREDKHTKFCLDRIVQPKFLHKVKYDERVIYKFAQRLFVENYNNFISKPTQNGMP